MLKKIIALSSLFFCFLIPNWHFPKNDLQKLNLKNNIVSISQRIYTAKQVDGIIHKKYIKEDPLENWDLVFNNKGFISEKKCFYSDNSLIFYYEYQYKQKNKITGRKMYDAQNYLLEHLQYVYDEFGVLAAQSTYKGDNSLLVRYVYEYSTKKQLIKSSVHAPYPSIYTTSFYTFDYNKKNELICQKTYNKNEQLYQTDSFWYDQNGFEKRHKIISHNDGFNFNSYSKYDPLGNLITYKAPAQNEPLTSYTYQFDSLGNWTQKLHFKNGKLTDIHERNIIYK